MDTAIKFLYLSEPDMVRAGVTDMDACVEAMEDLLLTLHKGDYVMGGKNHNSHGCMVTFPDDPEFEGMPKNAEDRRFMAMPAYLGGRYQMAGMKWYGSNMENKKKRVVAQSIEDKRGKTFADYQDEFEYLISAGIALNVQAISNPVFPLVESTGKNLLKLYLNDVGILTGILYGNNIRAVLDDEASINLGSVYESVVASELIAHGYELFYYDNRHKGEVDYLIDDYATLSAVPIEVKSGKDYTIHSALNNFVKNEDYHIQKAFVVSNERTVSTKGKIIYIPIYYIMFFQHGLEDSEAMQF